MNVRQCRPHLVVRRALQPPNAVLANHTCMGSMAKVLGRREHQSDSGVLDRPRKIGEVLRQVWKAPLYIVVESFSATESAMCHVVLRRCTFDCAFMLIEVLTVDLSR